MTNGDCAVMYVKDTKRSSPGTEDMGFCSGDDYVEETNINSPATGSCEDSNEIRVSPVSLTNKRKGCDSFTGPLKKRMCLKVKAESQESHPFRPWSPTPAKPPPIPEAKVKVEPLVTPKPEPSFGSYFRPPSPISFYQQTEPVSLVKRRDNNEALKSESDSCSSQDLRVPMHPQIQTLSTAETERMILKTNEMFPILQGASSSASTSSGSHKKQSESQRREQRNYKNMTRERRIEANARERTRVHTISAAFDTLRRSVPSYSHNQKLSKLSVLRIACSYIMTLSSIVNDEPSDEPSTNECVDMVSRTIQREGKLRKKKDDND